MKKTAITRRTPMPRSQKPLKRTRLKRKPQRDTPMLAEYRRLFPQCQYCGWRKATDIHELFSAGRRRVARAHRSCVLHLCRVCHEALQGARAALQCAVKREADPLGYDQIEYDRLTPGERPTQAEIDAEIEKARQGRRNLTKG